MWLIQHVPDTDQRQVIDESVDYSFDKEFLAWQNYDFEFPVDVSGWTFFDYVAVVVNRTSTGPVQPTNLILGFDKVW